MALPAAWKAHCERLLAEALHFSDLARRQRIIAQEARKQRRYLDALKADIRRRELLMSRDERRSEVSDIKRRYT